MSTFLCFVSFPQFLTPSLHTSLTLHLPHPPPLTVPRDTLQLTKKDCISVCESAIRANALDITMAEGVGTAGECYAFGFLCCL